MPSIVWPYVFLILSGLTDLSATIGHFARRPRDDATSAPINELDTCIDSCSEPLVECQTKAREKDFTCPIDWLMRLFSSTDDSAPTSRRRRQKRQIVLIIQLIIMLFSHSCDCVRLFVDCALDALCYECQPELVSPNFEAWANWKHPYLYPGLKTACFIETALIRSPVCTGSGKPNSSSVHLMASFCVVLVLLMLASFGFCIIKAKKAKAKQGIGSSNQKVNTSIGGMVYTKLSPMQLTSAVALPPPPLSMTATSQSKLCTLGIAKWSPVKFHQSRSTPLTSGSRTKSTKRSPRSLVYRLASLKRH